MAIRPPRVSRLPHPPSYRWGGWGLPGGIRLGSGRNGCALSIRLFHYTLIDRCTPISPVLSARFISVFTIKTPNSATILKSGQGQSAGNNILMINRQIPFSLSFYKYVGSSETTRVTSAFPCSNVFEQGNYKNTLTFYNSFGSWLAGLIEGAGSLLLSNNKVVSVEITLDAKDIQCLHKIKTTLGFGSIIKRSGVNAYRYRVYKKEHVLTILHLINGYLLTVSNHAQLIKLCSFFNLTPIIPDYPTSLLIIKNSSWLAGFFDAEGHFTIMNKFTLSCNLPQKDKLILECIKDSLQCGHIRYDKSCNGWIYTISNKEGIRFILDLFTAKNMPVVRHTYACIKVLNRTHHVHNENVALFAGKFPSARLAYWKHPKDKKVLSQQMGLCTLKYLDVCTFKRLLYKIDCKYHLCSINNPRRIQLENLIMLFKKRNINYQSKRMKI